MNTDDKIRAILKMEGDSVEPSAAGWDAIQQGIGTRRTRAWWTRGAALAGGMAVVVAAVAFVSIDRSPRGIDAPPATSGVTGSASPAPTASASPTPTAAPTTPNEPIEAIWPLTTTREVAAWEDDHSTYPALETASGSATAFARRYLAIEDATVKPLEGAFGENDFEVRRDDMVVSRVTVKGFGDEGTAPFVAIRATSDPLAIASPAAGAYLSGTTLTAKGSYEAVDPAIDVVLRGDDGGAVPFDLGRNRATTGPEGWSADVTFTAPVKTGSLLVTLASLKDGGIAAAAVIPVSFGTAPVTGPKAMVVARDGGIAVVSTATGAVVRWVVEGFDVGSLATDPELSDDGKTVVYAYGGKDCTTEIRSVPVTGGKSTTLLSGTDRVAHPSRRGGVLAYVKGACVEEGLATPETAVVRSGNRVVAEVDGRIVGGPVVGERFVAIAVARNGRRILHTVDAYGELADNPVTAPEGCDWGAPAWGPRDANDREQLFVTSSCSPEDEVVETRLYRFDADARNRVLVGTLDVRGVRTGDFAGEHLLLGTADGTAYAWHDGNLREIPGASFRPTWS